MPLPLPHEKEIREFENLHTVIVVESDEKMLHSVSVQEIVSHQFTIIFLRWQ